MLSIIVLIADPQRLFSGALAIALQRRFDIGVLDSRPTSWPEATEALEVLKPDVALLDYWMEGMETPQALRRLAETLPTCKFLVLSSLMSHDQIEEILGAGAVGCLPKTSSLETIADAIRRAYAGESPVYAEQLQQLMTNLDVRLERSVEDRKKLQSLTKRQIQILVALNSGLPIKELADELSVSPDTVKAHIKSILKKTGAKNQSEVLAMARSCGFMQA